MRSEEELVTILRELPVETVKALTELLRAMVEAARAPERRLAILARVDDLNAGGNVTAETIQATLADWRAEAAA
jgi:hypothetical protein